MLGKRPALIYAALALIILIAAVAAVQMVPGDSKDSAAAGVDFTINLSSPAGTTMTGVTWDGAATLTFNSGANEKVYAITQTDNSQLIRFIVFQNGVDTTAEINNINISGSVQLQGNASVKMLLAGSNDISGSIFMAPAASITFDSANEAGSADGLLNVRSTSVSYAGIGGGNVMIDGGTLTAIGGYYGAGIGGGDGTEGNVTINGGIVDSTGGYNGAGIGGGRNSAGGSVMINGGTVTATGGYYGAGIGGGYTGSGGTITINGGTIDATGNFFGAGIGGGWTGDGGTISINGGTVAAACSGNYGAGIGGGYSGAGGTISIYGGTVTATGGAGQGGAGIGGGYSGSGGAALSIGSGADIKAYSTGDLPALFASGVTGGGYFVNCVLSDTSPSVSSLVVYANGDPSTVLATLSVPSDCKGFAFTIPDSSASAEYNIYLQNSGRMTPVLRSSDGDPGIFSIKTLDGYNDYGSDADSGALPVMMSASVFVPVTDITGVPASSTAGKDKVLTGLTAPSGATNKHITWTIKDAGDTGATIEGNILSAADTGTIVVTATIADGQLAGASFTKDFTITVKAPGEEGGGSGSNAWVWVCIAIVIIVVLAIALFFLHKRGTI